MLRGPGCASGLRHEPTALAATARGSAVYFLKPGGHRPVSCPSVPSMRSGPSGANPRDSTERPPGGASRGPSPPDATGPRAAAGQSLEVPRPSSGAGSPPRGPRGPWAGQGALPPGRAGFLRHRRQRAHRDREERDGQGEGPGRRDAPAPVRRRAGGAHGTSCPAPAAGRARALRPPAGRSAHAPRSAAGSEREGARADLRMHRLVKRQVVALPQVQEEEPVCGLARVEALALQLGFLDLESACGEGGAGWAGASGTSARARPQVAGPAQGPGCLRPRVSAVRPAGIRGQQPTGRPAPRVFVDKVLLAHGHALVWLLVLCRICAVRGGRDSGH